MSPNIYIPRVTKNYRTPLRSVAKSKGILLGAAVSAGGLSSYGSFVIKTFFIVTPENELKMWFVAPNKSTINLIDAIKIFNYAKSNGIKVHGHTLVWNSGCPQWIVDISGTANRRAAMEDYIRQIVPYFENNFPETISAWDVVNEGVDEYGNERDYLFGSGYIQWSFELVRSISHVPLYINDFVMSPDWQKKILSLSETGLVDGVGLQMHLLASRGFDLSGMLRFTDKLRDLGCGVKITEADVATRLNNVDEAISKQGIWSALGTFVQESDCNMCTFWGVHDGVSWIPAFRPGYGDALLWDANMQPKSEYRTFYDALTTRRE